MRITVEILGFSANTNTPPSVLVQCEDLKLLFNAGEGLLTHTQETGIKLAGLEALFGTACDWNCWGGISDLTYYLAETQSKQLKVFGPTNTVDLGALFRYFLYSPNFRFDIEELEQAPVSFKHGISVQPILVKHREPPKPGKRSLTLNTNLRDNMEYEQDCAYSQQQRDVLAATWARCKSNFFKSCQKIEAGTYEWPPGTERKLKVYVSFDRAAFFETPVPNVHVLSYAIHTPEIPPKIDPKKAKELGITKGEDLGRLARGETVTLPNKTVILPEQVYISTAQPGPVALIVSCPSRDYTDDLVQSPLWQPYFLGGKFNNDSSKLPLVLHLTPDSVLKMPEYGQWMAKFGPTVEHVILNGENCPPQHSMHKWEDLFAKLSQIDPVAFHTQAGTFAQEPIPESLKAMKVTPAQIRMSFLLQPTNRIGFEKLSRTAVPKETREQDCKKLFSHGPLKEETAKYRALQTAAATASSTATATTETKLDHFDIVLLGTGAASSSNYRNETGILLDIYAYGCFLLDSGSNTYSQLARKYGPDIKRILKRLKAVWISHRHPDHHAGMLQVLIERQRCFEEDGEEAPVVTIIGPWWIEGYLLEYSLICRQRLHFTYTHGSKILTPTHGLSDFFRKELGLDIVQACYIWHCRDAKAIYLRSADGWSVAFSGDCRAPNPKSKHFIELARNATVLIHEASMADVDVALAEKKNHSTTKEALVIGEKMNAKFVLLTHFSQRQPCVPAAEDFDAYLQSSDETVQRMAKRGIVGFDLMTVHSRHLSLLPNLAPALVQLGKALPK